jgi:hypothetical protein
MKEWGIKISSQTSVAKGIQLALPKLLFGDNKVVEPRNGKFLKLSFFLRLFKEVGKMR